MSTPSRFGRFTTTNARLEGGKKHYGNNAWYNHLAELMEGTGDKNWLEYAKGRPLWFTETNCNCDNGDFKNPTQEEQCDRITGTSVKTNKAIKQKFGHGSIME